MDIRKLEGLIAAPPTPMGPDGAVDLPVIDRLHALLTANCVRGAFCCGTTGESMSLTVSERRAVAERWARVAEGDFVVIVHVGANSLPDCRQLAAHAQEIGAYAVGLMSPSFLRPACIDDLVAFCAEVAAAAPELPFYYYHIPIVTGVAFPVRDVMAAAAERIPTLAGAKFTYEDLMDYGRCLVLDGGRFDMLFGREENLLCALALGARGGVGTTYNLAAPVYRQVIDAFQAGDMAAAQDAQSKAREMMAVLRSHGGLAAVKPVMRMIGVDCGEHRLPLAQLSRSEVAALRSDLDAVGFFDFCCKA